MKETSSCDASSIVCRSHRWTSDDDADESENPPDAAEAQDTPGTAAGAAGGSPAPAGIAVAAPSATAPAAEVEGHN